MLNYAPLSSVYFLLGVFILIWNYIGAEVYLLLASPIFFGSLKEVYLSYDDLLHYYTEEFKEYKIFQNNNMNESRPAIKAIMVSNIE